MRYNIEDVKGQDFKLVLDSAKTDEGLIINNRLWKAKCEGKTEYYIADASADGYCHPEAGLPIHTDDGPQRVSREHNQKIVLRPWRQANGCAPEAYVRVHSECEDDKLYTTSIGMEGALYLAKKLKVPCVIEQVIYQP